MCAGKRKLVVILCITVLAASLSGCRKSPALVDEVYTEDAAQIAPDHEAYEPDEQGEEDSHESNKETESAESKQGEAATAAVRDDQADNNGTSRDNDKSAKENNDLENSGGQPSQAEGSGEGGASSGTNGMPDDTDAEPDNSIPSDKEDGNSQQGSNSEVPKKHVTDAYGVEQEIPEDVYTVTAVGGAAPIVAMVGGPGRLVGTSESFASNTLGSMILNSDPDVHTETWWTGDGSGPMGEAEFEQLLKAKPDLCFVIDGQSAFSSEQLTLLQQNGISSLTLPKLSSTEKMKEAVQIVAQALDVNESTGENANVIAQNYCSWVDKTLENTAENRKDLDYYSIYISEWRDDIRFERRYDPGFSYGDGFMDGFIVDFPASSGVVNGAGYGVAIASTDADGKPLLELWNSAGVRNCTEEDHIQGAILDAQRLGYTGMYIFPYMNEFGLPTFSDSSYYFPSDSSPDWYNVFDFYPFTWGLIWVGTTLGQTYDGSKHLGGSERYPAIVVADDYVKSMISSSPQWKAGFLEGINDSAKDIAGEYEIYVNPAGFDNWADGSVDSPLEAYWIQCKISGAISEDAMKTQVRNFYRDFYGITLSDSQINDIVNR